MFKVGDKVVCIDDYNGFNHIFKENEYLIKNKIYTIKLIQYIIDDGIDAIKLQEISDFSFSPHRFIPLLEFRKQKLKKICSKLEIR